MAGSSSTTRMRDLLICIVQPRRREWLHKVRCATAGARLLVPNVLLSGQFAPSTADPADLAGGDLHDLKTKKKPGFVGRAKERKTRMKFQFSATVRTRSGMKWYGGHGPVSTT